MKNSSRAIAIYSNEACLSSLPAWVLASILHFFAALPAFWRPVFSALLHLPDKATFPTTGAIFGLNVLDPSFGPHWCLVGICWILIFALRLLDCKLKHPGLSAFSDEFVFHLNEEMPPRWRQKPGAMGSWPIIAVVVIALSITAGALYSHSLGKHQNRGLRGLTEDVEDPWKVISGTELGPEQERIVLECKDQSKIDAMFIKNKDGRLVHR